MGCVAAAQTTSQPSHHLTSPRNIHQISPSTHLLIPNRKLPLRLAIRLRKLLQPLQRLILQHAHGKLDITLGVLVAGKYLGIIRQRRQRLV